MDFLANLSKLLEQAQNHQKDESQIKEVVHFILQVKQLQYIFDMRTESMKFYQKDQKNIQERLKTEFEALNYEKQKSEKLVDLVRQEISKLKERNKVVRNNYEKQQKEIDEKTEVFLSEIREGVSPEEVNRLIANNEKIEEDINWKIEEYKMKEKEFAEAEAQLEAQSKALYAISNKQEIEDKVELANSWRVEAELKIRAASEIRETIETMSKSQNESIKHFEDQYDQFLLNRKTILNLIAEIESDFDRGKQLEESITNSTKVYVELLSENESLRRTLNVHKRKTDAVRQQYSVLRNKLWEH